MRRRGWPGRIAVWLTSFVIGAVFGAAGTIAHATTIGWFPIGLVVGGVGCAAILLAVRLLTLDWAAGLSTGLGVAGTLLLFSGIGPGGSVLVQQSPLGLIWTFTVLALVLAVAAWPDLSRLRAARGSRLDA